MTWQAAVGSPQPFLPAKCLADDLDALVVHPRNPPRHRRRSIPIGFGFVQGYNAQAAFNEHQIVLAAEITNNSTDFSQLVPMVTATLEELERIGVGEPPEAVAADAGYWNEQHMDKVVANKGGSRSRCAAGSGRLRARAPAPSFTGTQRRCSR